MLNVVKVTRICASVHCFVLSELQFINLVNISLSVPKKGGGRSRDRQEGGTVEACPAHRRWRHIRRHIATRKYMSVNAEKEKERENEIT